MKIDRVITPSELSGSLARMFQLAAAKSAMVEKAWNGVEGAPVFTAAGKYMSRGWTEWTQGFQYGCGILAFEGTGEKSLLESARRNVAQKMAGHVSHVGVHDHGFNNISTYGNLRRLMREGRIEANEWEMAFYELALKCSGAVQAARWSKTSDGGGGGGYIYSFNGPHSLFVDTIRTLRVVGLAHQLGHVLMGENDVRTSLLGRLVGHGMTTAKYNVYYGEGRDAYDVPGRTAHEAIFNCNDGEFRCASSQQGYSPLTTWTRGLAWAALGFAEEVEFFDVIRDVEFAAAGFDRAEVRAAFLRVATVTADFYLDQATAADGIPYWDTGAPGLAQMGDWRGREAEPFNDHEPVDSSAAAIAAQGLIRLGWVLGEKGERYTRAGLLIAARLLEEPYLSGDLKHQGLLLHSVYHRPKGWDYVPPGRKIPCGEASLWGDYHLLELGVLIQKMIEGKYLMFFDSGGE
jgi:hypothetical protein